MTKQITMKDVNNFGKQLENVDKKTPVENNIIGNGNCFFHALHYAIHNNLSQNSLDSMRQICAKIVIQDVIADDQRPQVSNNFAMLPELNKNKKVDEILQDRHSIYKISDVLPIEYVNPHGGVWKYSEEDIIGAAAGHFNIVIVIISKDERGGLTVFKSRSLEIPKISKNNVVFLINHGRYHYVAFKSASDNLKPHISNEMLQKLKWLLTNRYEASEYYKSHNRYSYDAYDLFNKPTSSINTNTRKKNTTFKNRTVNTITSPIVKKDELLQKTNSLANRIFPSVVAVSLFMLVMVEAVVFSSL